jgi:hypothetical protein
LPQTCTWRGSDASRLEGEQQGDGGYGGGEDLECQLEAE